MKNESTIKYIIVGVIIAVTAGLILDYIRSAYKTPNMNEINDPPEIKVQKKDKVVSNNDLRNSRFAQSYGKFIDKRDNQEYKWIKIGEQIWMAENLAYTPDESDGYFGYSYWNGGTNHNVKNKLYCKYKHNNENLRKYGYLYTYEAIMNGGSPNKKNRGISPEGWHIPSDEEWKKLERYLGISEIEVDRIYYRGIDAGTKLKSTSGWSRNRNGTDLYGFNALPMGYCHHSDGSFYNLLNYATFWSSTETSNSGAWARYLSYEKSTINRYFDSKKSAFALRCIKD